MSLNIDHALFHIDLIKSVHIFFFDTSGAKFIGNSLAICLIWVAKTALSAALASLMMDTRPYNTI